MKELTMIQNELKAPKDKYNSFGKYAYRSAEGILEAVKPLIYKHECVFTLSDDIQLVGDRFYVKAIATITNKEGNQVTVTAFAREDETKKGMDGSQITGAASSYARKYAMNGLFCIDDTKEADTEELHETTNKNTEVKESPITYREQVIRCAKSKGIGMVELAKDYGLNSETTEDRYKEVLEDLTGK